MGLPRLAVTALVLTSLAALFNVVSSLGLTGHDSAITRASDPSLEASIRHDEFLTHDLYYLSAVLRKVAKGGTVLVPSRDILNDHVSLATIDTIAAVEVETSAHDSSINPQLRADVDIQEWRGSYKRRPSNDRAEFRVLVASGGSAPTLVFFETDYGLALIDQETLEEPPIGN